MWELILIVCWEKRTLSWDMIGVLRMLKEVLGFFSVGTKNRTGQRGRYSRQIDFGVK